MVQAQGYEVSIVRHDDQSTFPEFEAPVDSLSYTEDPNEVFIEAETGVRFDILVQLHGELRGKSPHVKISYSLDGQRGCCLYAAARKSDATALVRWSKKHSFEYDAQYVNEEWIACGFLFNELGIGRTSTLFSHVCLCGPDQDHRRDRRSRR